jgi:hypothetical protein
MWFTLDKFLEFDLIWLLYINLFDLLLLTCFTFCVWSVARVTVFRVKFLYFIFLLALVSIWGVYYSFDAFIFLLLMAEFLILLLFLITALSFNFINSTRTLPTTLFYWFYGLTLLLYIGVVPHTVNLFLQSYHMIYHYIEENVHTDFFIFFYGFFIQYTPAIFYIALILSFFSIFFIWNYYTIRYTLRERSNHTAKVSKTVELLRKQQPRKQTKVKVQVRMFKK